MKSLYQLIHRSLTPEGLLPEDFSLPKPDGNQIHFADGAMDGITIFHTANGEADTGLLEQAVCAANRDRMEEAQGLVREFCETGHMIGAIDGIQQYIIDHQKELAAGKIFRLGEELMFGGTHPEAVKFGLALLELFDLNGKEPVKAAVRELACSDEFTIFTLLLMRSWDDPDREIFQAAKKARGWGRIHAVERLNPVDEEMERWLLAEGWDNTVLPAYSALECFQKARCTRILEGNMTREQYGFMTGLMAGLLDEGPVRGISACENPEEVLNAFLRQSGRFELTAADYSVIAQILDYAKEHSLDAAAAVAGELLESQACRAVMQREMEKGEGLRLAKRLGMDYAPYAMAAIERDFHRYYHYVDLLMPGEDYAMELIRLFEERLPLEEMACGSADEMGLGEEFENYRILIYMVQHLKDRPGMGVRLIRTALNAPVVNNRNMALTVLEEWGKLRGCPLAECYPELAGLLRELRENEVREDVRNRMDALIGEG